MNEPTELFDLDINRLDEHWLSHSRTVYDHALQLADAKADYDRLKRKRDVIGAELKQSIRKNPESYDCPKITEAVVEEVMLLQERYQRAEDRVTDAKHKVDLLQAMLDGLEAKKKSLENLVNLFSMSYFSQPRSPAIAKAAVDEMETNKAFGGKRGKRVHPA